MEHALLQHLEWYAALCGLKQSQADSNTWTGDVAAVKRYLGGEGNFQKYFNPTLKLEYFSRAMLKVGTARAPRPPHLCYYHYHHYPAPLLSPTRPLSLKICAHQSAEQNLNGVVEASEDGVASFVGQIVEKSFGGPMYRGVVTGREEFLYYRIKYDDKDEEDMTRVRGWGVECHCRHASPIHLVAPVDLPIAPPHRRRRSWM